jgi:ABC-type amino acid transport substrate-binding protein
MKRLFSAIALAALSFSALAQTPAPAAGAGGDTLDKIAKSGKILLSYRESSVPFSYLAGGTQAVGLSVDISNAVVESVKKRLNMPNLKVEWQAVTSANRIPLVQNGTIDLECGSTTNNSDRGKQVTFAINHFYTGTRLLAKKSSGIKNYADLAKKTYATTTGTTNALVMRKYTAEQKLETDVILGKDHADSMLMVDVGRAVAFAMDDILLYGLIGTAKNPAEWEVVGDALQVEPYACFFRKDDPKFAEVVNGTISGLMRSGEFEKMYNKWFMQPIPPRNTAIGLPMSKELRDNLKALSDKPAM